MSANSDEPSTSSPVQETTPQPSSILSAEREQPVAECAQQPEISAATAIEGEDQTDSPSKTKRKNRCTTCRKKVGLTGRC